MMRTVVQSALFSIVLIIIYYGIQIGYGYYKTLNYVPDIMSSYDSVDYLQHKVAFGTRVRPFGFFGEFVVLLGSGIIIFTIGKFILKRIKQRN
ncbi:MAG: hypothetical protein K0S39_5704 [Paenibacillus sp.]|jgi:quinol-cytochrome oxidoreductase complex cytochrome b subunit|nr:hypothetical protein [Paenibacillus sp.]